MEWVDIGPHCDREPENHYICSFLLRGIRPHDVSQIPYTQHQRGTPQLNYFPNICYTFKWYDWSGPIWELPPSVYPIQGSIIRCITVKFSKVLRVNSSLSHNPGCSSPVTNHQRKTGTISNPSTLPLWQIALPNRGTKQWLWQLPNTFLAFMTSDAGGITQLLFIQKLKCDAFWSGV